MRIIVAAAAIVALAPTVTDANAVICGRGRHRAGCVCPNETVVTHRHCH
jgi:hypothetical protein